MPGAPVVIGWIGRPHGLGGEVRTRPTGATLPALRPGQSVEVQPSGGSPAGWWWRAARGPTRGPSCPSRASGPARRPWPSPARPSPWSPTRWPRCPTRTPSTCATWSGCEVLLGERPAGTVAEVHAAPANDVLEVSGSDGDLLVPFTADAIVELDLASRRIVVRADLLVRLTRRADRRLHALPRMVRLDAPAPSPRQRRDLGRPRAALLLAARHHAAAPCAGRRLAVRRRPRDGDARRRDGRGAGGRLREPAERGAGRRARVAVLTPRGRPFTDAVARELADEPRPHAALRPLRGLRRARDRDAGQRRALSGPVRARRAARWPRWPSSTPWGGACRARWATPRASPTSRSPRPWAAASSTPTTRVPRISAAVRCPTCSSRATTAPSHAGGAERVLPPGS